MRFVIDLEKAQATATKADGRWVTIKKEGPLKGRHVFIDGSGQITKGKGIPSHVIHHLNSKAGKGHLKGAEDSHPDPLERAKMAAKKATGARAWVDTLGRSSDEFKALKEHSEERGVGLPELFNEFKHGHKPTKDRTQEHLDRAIQHARKSGDMMAFGDKMSKDPDALAAVKSSGKQLSDLWDEHGGKDEDPHEKEAREALERAKQAAPDHKDADAWIDHLGGNDIDAFLHVMNQDEGNDALFKKWGGGSKYKPSEEDLLDQAKQEAPNHADEAKWMSHLRKNSPDAHDALKNFADKTAQSPASLFSSFGGGSKAKPNHPTPEALSDHVEKSLQDHEKTIRDRPTEMGTLHSKDSGAKVWGEDQGKKDEVNLAEPVRQGIVKGTILTHNHPSGNSFSSQDINFMLAHGLHEIRAVSKKHIHRMQPPEHWPDKPTQQDLDNMYSSLAHIENGVKSEFWDAINSNRMSVDQAQERHWHEVWTRAAKQLGFRYERSEWND